MADQELQLPDGRTLVIPDNITLDQRTALRNKLGDAYADPKTGQGMEQRALQQSHRTFTGNPPTGYDATGRPVYSGKPTLMQSAEQEQADRETQLGERMNRAGRSPTPVSTAVSAYAPVTAARAIAGGKVGSAVGDKVAPGGWGNLVGGIVGGTAASYTPGSATKLAQRITRGPGGTGEVTINPATAATRELETTIPRNEPPGARQQMQTQLGQQNADAIARQQAAIPKPAMSKIPTRMPVRPSPVPPGATLSASPTQTATLPAPGPINAPTTSGVSAGGQPVPLVTRTAARMPIEGANLTRRIILPGEEIDPMARSSAGSAAQATEGDLRRLAQAGDASARQELVRRRLPMGSEAQIDYSKAPLPKGTLVERVGESDLDYATRRGPGVDPMQRSIKRQFDKVGRTTPRPKPSQPQMPDVTVEEQSGPSKLELQRQARERAARIRGANQ